MRLEDREQPELLMVLNAMSRLESFSQPDHRKLQRLDLLSSACSISAFCSE